MKGLVRLVMLVLLLLLALSLGLAALLYQSEPLVSENSSVQVNDADTVKALLNQVSGSLKNRAVAQKISFSEEQLNSLVGLLQRANANLNGRIRIVPEQANFQGSYRLPDSPIGGYLNVDIRLLAGKGLVLEHVKIGSLSIPGSWAIFTFTNSLDWYTHSDIATQLIQQVEEVDLINHQMVLGLRPLGPFLKELNSIKQELSPGGDEELALRTAYYLKYLASLPAGQQSQAASLASFIGPLFNEVRQRSNSDLAVMENQAAILALAAYVGHYRFGSFVGNVQPVAGKIAAPKTSPVLAGRSDLNLHFVFSAAIKVLSEQGLSFAIGEFKELMDRGADGSGYSFVDLTADYAGVRFAETATQADSARILQKMLANISDEAVFFPTIQDLPEGLNKEQFTQIFKHVDSEEYSKVMQILRARVDALPLHQVP